LKYDYYDEYFAIYFHKLSLKIPKAIFSGFLVSPLSAVNAQAPTDDLAPLAYAFLDLAVYSIASH
jgi:hypothetical protein